MNFIILASSFFLFSLSFNSSSLEDPYCKTSVNPMTNIGYCVKGTDGKGKCIMFEFEGASRCSDDQPITVQ